MQNWMKNEEEKQCRPEVSPVMLCHSMTLDIIHLILPKASVFQNLRNFYNCLLKQPIWNLELDFLLSRGSLVLCFYILTREHCTERPKKSGRITKQQQIPTFSSSLTAIHLSHIFLVHILNKRDRSWVQNKLCSFKSFCCHLSLCFPMAKVHS